MILIGENLNITSKKVTEALKNKDRKLIREIAEAQAKAGMDMLEINIGPAPKAGPEIIDWVIGVVREVTDVPLSLDTTNIKAIEAGLQIHKGKALINSISARPERMDALLPLAKKYNASFVGLTLGVEGFPRDANERGFLAAQIIAEAAQYSIPEEDIWLDPITPPIKTQQLQIQGCTEFAMMLLEAFPSCKSIYGGSNISNGIPGPLRGILNRTYLIILKRHGMYSAIVDAFDSELKAIAKGQRPDLEKLVYKVMDGETLDTSMLSEEEIRYVKTTRVLLGQNLYSDSWLEL
jgi:5-methyltetrahydrofolate corrinoid/iron sulfur protein methyltransferase